MAVDQEKKTATRKTPAKKAPVKKAPVKKAAAKKTTARKPAAKKIATKKTSAAKPSAPLKAGATKAAASNASTTNDLKDRAINKARSTANDGKAKAGEAIGTLSEMIENSAKTIDENVGEKYGDYARSAADAVSSFAEKVNSKDVDVMVEDAREFVRKKPAVAIGAAAVVGLLISRLIKSGTDDRT
ncbi:hypothetical protein [Parasphingorhabdus cellanae]|uniref:DUF883 domain-containing protein n=1 Tax=Parasphingorhabdus cellanae TaxID=2806553 RepID=A0ABX7T5I1_9SPHN|nr:hypothetical protein [Parasphingorhabdus cellanae]QTD56178.1 hypothetical protein J4G78_00785 [Parasphingorhabdus cellanae]